MALDNKSNNTDSSDIVNLYVPSRACLSRSIFYLPVNNMSKCRLCGKNYKHNPKTTSNLLLHVKAEHADVYDQLKQRRDARQYR